MPESFTCHQCHRPQRIGRRHWTKYQPVYSEGPRWVGRGEDECVCEGVCVYMSIPTGDCDCQCKGFGVCMCRDYVVWGSVKNLDSNNANNGGDTPHRSYIQACLCVPEKEREFHSVPQKQTAVCLRWTTHKPVSQVTDAQQTTCGLSSGPNRYCAIEVLHTQCIHGQVITGNKCVA